MGVSLQKFQHGGRSGLFAGAARCACPFAPSLSSGSLHSTSKVCLWAAPVAGHRTVLQQLYCVGLAAILATQSWGLSLPARMSGVDSTPSNRWCTTFARCKSQLQVRRTQNRFHRVRQDGRGDFCPRLGLAFAQTQQPDSCSLMAIWCSVPCLTRFERTREVSSGKSRKRWYSRLEMARPNTESPQKLQTLGCCLPRSCGASARAASKAGF